MCIVKCMVNNKRICGIDEAGRGAFAGPLVCAAVTLPLTFMLSDFPRKIVFRDSKKMSERQREKAYEKIFDFAIDVKTVSISADAINKRGVGWANWYGFRKLIYKVCANRYILDGIPFKQSLSNNSHFMIKADAVIPAVICASIIAKVTRDNIMRKLGSKYKQYAWQANKGYGTKFHREKIINFGVTNQHRILFVKNTLVGYHYT